MSAHLTTKGVGGEQEGVGAVEEQVWKVGGFIAVACLINFPESQLTCGCGSKSQTNFPLLSQLFGPLPSISDYFPFGFACQIEVCQGEGSGVHHKTSKGKLESANFAHKTSAN